MFWMPLMIGVAIGIAVAMIIAGLAMDFYLKPNNKRGVLCAGLMGDHGRKANELIDEEHQGYIIGRSNRFGDVILDTASATAFSFFGAKKLRKKQRDRRQSAHRRSN